YSPDGQWLVFVRNPQLGDLWRVPAAGGTPEQLTNEAAELRGWAPWHPCAGPGQWPVARAGLQRR
ncbi:hypothetical protein C7E12_19090, partial [Stenotrophomonas maltophilia]